MEEKIGERRRREKKEDGRWEEKGGKGRYIISILTVMRRRSSRRGRGKEGKQEGEQLYYSVQSNNQKVKLL